MILQYAGAYIVGLILTFVFLVVFLGVHVTFWVMIVDEYNFNDTTTSTIVSLLVMIVVVDIIPWAVGLFILPPWGK